MWVANDKCGDCGTQSKDEYVGNKIVYSSGCACGKYKYFKKEPDYHPANYFFDHATSVVLNREPGTLTGRVDFTLENGITYAFLYNKIPPKNPSYFLCGCI